MWINQNGKVWYSEAEYMKLKQAISQINKILEKSCKECMNEFLNADYCSEGDCFQIKQIIDEVLNV